MGISAGVAKRPCSGPTSDPQDRSTDRTGAPSRTQVFLPTPPGSRGRTTHSYSRNSPMRFWTLLNHSTLLSRSPFDL